MPILSLFEGRVDYPVTVTFLYNLSRCSSKQEKKNPICSQKSFRPNYTYQSLGYCHFGGKDNIEQNPFGCHILLHCCQCFPSSPIFFFLSLQFGRDSDLVLQSCLMDWMGLWLCFSVASLIRSCIVMFSHLCQNFFPF